MRPQPPSDHASIAETISNTLAYTPTPGSLIDSRARNSVASANQARVERRTPINPAAPGAPAFEERVVEVRETAEEPVVAKKAQVVEEVVIGREATERTETVRDTVRREDVEVSKDGEVKR